MKKTTTPFDFTAVDGLLEKLENKYMDDTDISLDALQLLELRNITGALSRIVTLLKEREPNLPPYPGPTPLPTDLEGKGHPMRNEANQVPVRIDPLWEE